MAFRELVKNGSFLTGFIIGFIFTLGRAWISFIERMLRPLFDFWDKFWSSGLVLEIVPLYISGLIVFLFVIISIS